MPEIAAIVLAAGTSERFGEDNKLLAELQGRPMLCHVVEHVSASQAAPVMVVLGHQADAVRAAVLNQCVNVTQDVSFVKNSNYAKGLSTSLKAGITALGPQIDGALICLGDMPLVGPALLDALIAGFDPAAGKSIVMPVHERQQGNPVLWGRAHFAALADLSGDQGAKPLLAQNEERTARIDAGPQVLRDADHAAALAAFRLELGRDT